MQITFMGATGTVTGSKYLLTAESKKILIDCGLFQGYKELRLRNWARLPIAPSEIDAVVLTHAHIDHSGYLPLLVKHGFKGKIYCTPATRDLCEILLPDSGFLQEEEAKFANRFKSSKHTPALPLYTEEEAHKTLKYFSVVDFHQNFTIADIFKIRFYHAGHILGAACVNVHHKNTSLLFSGDLGRPHDPVMKAPENLMGADYVILESTYGNRQHESENPQKRLGELIRETAKHGGTVLIPAFAVGRAQSILYHIYQLRKSGQIPHLPVFLDSPMATNATLIFHHYKNEHRLTESEATAVCNLPTYIQTLEESQNIDHLNVPSIIISASGMATGGRVLHHLKQLAPQYRNTIIFCGYQAGGTRGDRMVRGEHQVKIYGEMVPIKAKIAELHNLSAHSDYLETLDWISQFKPPPKKIFITHGEPEAAKNLKNQIEQKLHWNCEIPQYLQTENLA